MNDVQRLLAETATQLFSRHATSGDVAPDPTIAWSPALWRVLEETGLTLVGVPEERGGGGGTLEDAALVVGIAARFAAPVPLGETCLLGGWLLDAADLACPPGPLTAAIVADDQGRGVPYARHAAGIAVLVERERGALIGLARPGQYRGRAGRQHGRGAPRHRHLRRARRPSPGPAGHRRADVPSTGARCFGRSR